MADTTKVWAVTMRTMRYLPLAVTAGRRLSVLAIGVTLGGMLPSAGWAQMLGTGGPIGTSGRAMGPKVPSNAADKPALPAPEAIPGSKPMVPAAPPTHAPSDMQPSDALFDAINRGDITAARDALSRGADLSSVNILGMTPMELSVDLGRNDISFLLLSMRGEDSDRGARAVGRDTPPPSAAKDCSGSPIENADRRDAGQAHAGRKTYRSRRNPWQPRSCSPTTAAPRCRAPASSGLAHVLPRTDAIPPIWLSHAARLLARHQQRVDLVRQLSARHRLA